MKTCKFVDQILGSKYTERLIVADSRSSRIKKDYKSNLLITKEQKVLKFNFFQHNV